MEGFASRAEALRNKWFSRRNRTGEAREAHWDGIRSEERAATEEAAERGAKRAEAEQNGGPLSLIRRLDMRFGVGKGAKRERAKLHLRLEAKRMKVDVSDVTTFVQLRGRIAMAKAKAEVAAIQTEKQEAKEAARTPTPRPKG